MEEINRWIFSHEIVQSSGISFLCVGLRPYRSFTCKGLLHLPTPLPTSTNWLSNSVPHVSLCVTFLQAIKRNCRYGWYWLTIDRISSNPNLRRQLSQSLFEALKVISQSLWNRQLMVSVAIIPAFQNFYYILLKVITFDLCALFRIMLLYRFVCLRRFLKSRYITKWLCYVNRSAYSSKYSVWYLINWLLRQAFGLLEIIFNALSI